MSVWASSWNTSAPTGRVFVKFDIWVFFENLSRKFTFDENMTRNYGYFTRAPMHMGISHEHLCTWVFHMSTYAHGYFTWAPMHMGISHEHLCTWVFHMSTYAHGYFTRAPMHMGTSHEHLCTWVLHTSTYAHGYFTRAPMYIYDNILLISSKNEKCFRQKL